MNIKHLSYENLDAFKDKNKVSVSNLQYGQFLKASCIIDSCSKLMPEDRDHLKHEVIQRFGSPLQQIYVDESNVDINGVNYQNPLILPIYDEHLTLVQCAVLQDGQSISVIPDGLAKGFARYGDFDHAKPVIITYSLEAFFKIAQTGYAVVLVILPNLCHTKQTELKAFDFEQIQFVINQLFKVRFCQVVYASQTRTNTARTISKATAKHSCKVAESVFKDR